MLTLKKPLTKGKRGLFFVFIGLLFIGGIFWGFNSFNTWLFLPETAATMQKPSIQEESGAVKGVTSEIIQGQSTQVEKVPGSVKAVEDDISENSLVFRLKVFFLDAIRGTSAEFDESVTVGTDLSVANDVDIAGDLTVGDNLVVSGSLIAPNTIYSLIANNGLTVSGTQDITISNSDPGSAQNIFKNLKFNSSTISADSNDDTLTFESGAGISFSNSGKTVTIAASGSDLNVSGWFDDGTTVRLVNSTDNVGIGTSAPGYKLDVIGSGHISGATTLGSSLNVAAGITNVGGINNSLSGITNTGVITGATGLTSSGTITFSGISTGVVQSSFGGVISSGALNLAGGSSYLSGTLPVTNGGTGLTGVLAGDLIYASGTDTLASLGLGGDGQVLTVSGGTIAWGSAGGSGPCASCLINDPGTTQVITPSAATAIGLSIKQANSGSVDVFNVTSYDGLTKYFRVDSTGNVLLGSGVTSTMGNLSIAPTGTDPITISPVAQGAGQFTGTLTSSDLTADRTWTFPNESGIVCLATGNCSGTSAGIGGSGAAGYLSKWTDTYTVGASVLYDNGTNIGIGTTNPTSKFHVSGTVNLNGTTTIGGALSALSSLNVTGVATLSSSLRVDGATDLNDTLEVSGVTTLGSTLGVTGQGTFGGNVGIGSLSPSQALDVTGSIRLGTASANNVLGTSTSGGSPTGVMYWGNRTICDSSGNCSGTAASVGGSGTTNYISKWSSTYGLGNSLLFDDGTNVGIGTTVPTKTLDIDGDVEAWVFEANNSGFRFDGDSDTGMIRLGTNQLALEAGGTNFLNIFNSTQNIITIGDSVDTDIDLDGNMFIEGSSGNIGIGTTVPGYKLDVQGDIGLGSYPQGSIYHNGDSDTYMGFGNNKIYLQAGGTPNIQISDTQFTGNYVNQATMDFAWDGDFLDGFFFVDVSSESVGIGTNTPVGKFNLTGAATGKALAILNETGNQAIFVASASGTNKFIIQNDGNVGIGTTSPGAELNLSSGSIKIGTSDCNNSFCLDGSGFHTGWDYTITNHNGGSLLLMPDGNVGIGTTTANAKLDVNGTIYFGTQIVARADTDTKFVFGTNKIELQAGGLRLLTSSMTSAFTGNVTGNLNRHNVDFNWYGDTNSEFFTLDAGVENVGIGTATPGQKLDVVGSARFSAVGSGAYSADLNLTSDGTLTTNSSDIRLKENLVELNDLSVLNKVLALKTYTFDWKNGGAGDVGMIAQEVSQIFPEITFTNKVDGYMGINYSRLPSLLVSAVQEQQNQLNQLNLKIDAQGAVVTSEIVSSPELSIEEKLSVYAQITQATWKFLNEVIFTAKTTFLASVEFIQEVTFKGPVKFNADTVGTFNIPQGATKVRVAFKQEFSQVPRVYLSTQTNIVGGYVLESVGKNGFTVRLLQAQTGDILVDWLAVLGTDTTNATVQVLEEGTTPQVLGDETIVTLEPLATSTSASTAVPTPTPSPTTDLESSIDLVTENTSPSAEATASAQQ